VRRVPSIGLGYSRGGTPLIFDVCFQGGHISSWRGPSESYALSSVAVAGGWSLLLLSALLSGAVSRVDCCRPIRRRRDVKG
jgi:hypothetical protein